ncbi:hypothetical protein N2152v2_000779 [Parachlorella kessleri]
MAVEVIEQALAGAAGSNQAGSTGQSALAAPVNANPCPELKIALTGEKVCLTGVDHWGRGYITTLLEKAGAEVQKAVGLDTNYLFCTDPNSGSAKLRKVRSWGVKVVSYDDLIHADEMELILLFCKFYR